MLRILFSAGKKTFPSPDRIFIIAERTHALCSWAVAYIGLKVNARVTSYDSSGSGGRIKIGNMKKYTPYIEFDF